MNWIYGFFMAWGMFLAIPCPVRIWREEARQHMLACLPLVGALVGGLWALLAWLLRGAPGAVRALLLAALPWLVTGFLHLDGYMDVCDAILSRRDLETRRKILKDSHCGAFAVICLVLLVLAQYSCFREAGTLRLWVLALIPVASRASSGLAVLLLRPMGTSQYAAMGRGGRGKAAVLAVLLLAAAGFPLALGRSAAPAAACAAYWLAIWEGTHQLGGMSGDISGFGLTLAELTGAAVLCLWG